jgi:hypothetical protein
MDGLSVVALALGVTGVLVGGLAWRQARAATAQAGRATRLAQEALQTAAAAMRPATDATAAWSARPEAGPPGAQGGDTPPSTAPGADRAATLVVRSDRAPGQALPTHQGSGSGRIGLFLVNTGPAVAHDVQLFAVFPNGTVRTSAIHQTLSVHKELTLLTQVIPQDFGAATRVDVLYRVAYRDGTGPHDLVQRVHVEGGWTGLWTTYLDAEAAGARGCRGGTDDASPTPAAGQPPARIGGGSSRAAGLGRVTSGLVPACRGFDRVYGYDYVTGVGMGTTTVEALSPAEQEQFAAMAERVRELRRQAGVPDGLTLAEAIALGILRLEELERARWGSDPDDRGRPS